MSGKMLEPQEQRAPQVPQPAERGILMDTTTKSEMFL
jgi:hypothetical protein